MFVRVSHLFDFTRAFWWRDRFDDAYFLEPESVAKTGSGATPVSAIVRSGGGGGENGGGGADKVLTAAKELSEKSADNVGVVRVEVDAPSKAVVHDGGACLNGIGGAGRSKKGASCEREEARRRGDCTEGVVAQADPGGEGTVSGGGVEAGIEERRNNGACTELGFGDPRGHSGSADQILAATDRACSKRPRKEDERGAL